MDAKTLKTFHQIVEHGSFIRAAEEMNYAQSTVTMQIQKLEADTGIRLIERGKRIQLTEAGRLFWEKSLPILKHIEQLQEDMARLLEGTAGHIRLGVTEPTASCRLPGLLRSFLDQYPKIRVSVEFGNTPLLSERLVKGDIDFALCSAPDLGSELLFEPLFKEEFVVLMPEDHPLAHRASIVPEDFRGHRLLVTSGACPYRRKLEIVLQEAGGIALDTMEIGSMTALKSFVESGIGIALVPKITVDPVPSSTVARPISGSLVEMSIGILCKTVGPSLESAGYRLYHFLSGELQGQ